MKALTFCRVNTRWIVPGLLLATVGCWIGHAAVLSSYENESVQLIDDSTALMTRVNNLLEHVGTSQPNYQGGQQLRLLLTEQGDVTDRAYALWEEHPDKVSAFWLYEREMCIQLAYASMIMFLEGRGGAGMAELSAAQSEASIQAQQAARAAFDLGI